MSVASAGATILASFAFETPATIVRIRGMLSIELQTYAADLDIAGAVGMGIVSAEAFAAGVASVPEPFTDADWGGWMMWRSFAHRFEFVSNTGSFFPAEWTMEIDSKAMRKVDNNEVLIIVAESQSGAIAVASPLRVLIKLA